MKIECIHGYFKFSETGAGQISDFMSRFGFELERSGDHITFSDLIDAPDYSIAGGTFLGAPCVKTFEGAPWEVMRENALIYDFTKGRVMPLLSVLQTVKIQSAGNFFLAGGMILPGSITEDGLRVTDYSAFYVWERLNFKYSEVGYV